MYTFAFVKENDLFDDSFSALEDFIRQFSRLDESLVPKDLAVDDVVFFENDLAATLPPLSDEDTWQICQAKLRKIKSRQMNTQNIPRLQENLVPLKYVEQLMF